MKPRHSTNRGKRGVKPGQARASFWPIRKLARRASSASPVPITRIVVAVDFSAESTIAIRYADVLARQFGASLTLMHVVEPIICAADFGYGPVTQRCPNQELIKKARTRLALLGKRLLPARLRLVGMVRTGVAETEIVEVARALETDLIVMGAHANRGPGPVPIGGTAEGVVRRAPCPVIVVRQKEHESSSCGKSR